MKDSAGNKNETMTAERSLKIESSFELPATITILTRVQEARSLTSLDSRSLHHPIVDVNLNLNVVRYGNACYSNNK
jgi:hypothetical protein